MYAKIWGVYSDEDAGHDLDLDVYAKLLWHWIYFYPCAWRYTYQMMFKEEFALCSFWSHYSNKLLIMSMHMNRMFHTFFTHSFILRLPCYLKIIVTHLHNNETHPYIRTSSLCVHRNGALKWMHAARNRYSAISP